MPMIRLFKPANLVRLATETIIEHNDWAWGSAAITASGTRLDYDTGTGGGITALRVSHSGRISFEISGLGDHKPSDASWLAYWKGNMQPLFSGFLSGDDLMLGTPGNDHIMGYGGNDKLHAGSGADWLGGGAGDDNLSADAGNDALYGGDGADRLLGGTGNDRLTGGAGADKFVFLDNDGTDTITDFQNGVDKFLIVSGADRFADLRIVDAGANTVIHYGDDRIVLTNIDHRLIDANDFAFA